jgi:hypothetical protein
LIFFLVAQVDIKVFSNSPSEEHPHILIGFEAGYPDMDYDDRGAASIV